MSTNSHAIAKFITIPDDYHGYPTDVFCVPKHYEDSLQDVLIPRGLVDNRIDRLARDISDDFGSDPIAALCVLKGGYRFFADLVEKMTNLTAATPISVDFIRLRSYVDDKSTGEVQVIGGDNLETLKGKNVLVVEDIIETGNTMEKLLRILNKHQPKNIKVASLLVKRRQGKTTFKPDYVGFEIPDRFVVGYALDYNEHFRDLSHICVINEHGKKKYATQI